MKFVMMVPQSNRIVTRDGLLRTLEAAEELGFHGVSVRDHISFNGAWISSGMRDIAGGDDRDFYESMQTLAFIAGRTERLKIGVSVVVLPNRHPVLFAKQAATLDVLSEGRLFIGVGVGPPSRPGALETTKLGGHLTNAEKEYHAFDVTGNRGPRTNEYLEAVYTIWSEESATFHGEYVSFQDLDIFPKPVQQPRPPVLVGGRSDHALRRAARYGEGWIPSQITVEEVRSTVPRLGDFYANEGRKGPDVVGVNQICTIGHSDAEADAQTRPTVSTRVFYDDEQYRNRTIVGSPDTFTARLKDYEAAGANWIEMRPVYPTIDNLIEQMQLIHDEVMPAFSSTSANSFPSAGGAERSEAATLAPGAGKGDTSPSSTD